MHAFVSDLADVLSAFALYPLLACLLAATLGPWRGATRRRPLRRVAWAATAAAIWVVHAPAWPNHLVALLEQRHAPLSAADEARLATNGGPTILVLASGWFRATAEGPRAQLDAATWARTQAGVRLWQRSGGRLLFSGAPASDGSGSVAREMAELARAWGVPADRIALEEASGNTRENLVNSSAMLGRMGQATTVLVTSAMHMPRALAAAERLGMRVLPFPCDYRADEISSWRDWLPTNSAPAMLDAALHEWAGLWVYRWRGWA